MTSRTSVSLPKGFDWEPLISRVRSLGGDWVNRAERDQYVRLLTVGRRRLLIRCAPKSGRMLIHIVTSDGQAAPAEARAEVRRVIRHIFSLDLDWPSIRKHLSADPALGRYVKRVREYRPMRAASLFEALIDSIVGQQVNYAFATTLRNRLVEEFGATARHNGEIYYAFPTPTRLAKASVSLLREMQLSERKAEYILGVAKRFERPFLLNGGGDGDRERLLELRGIGPWSAEYALMQGGGALDVVPAGDVSLQARLHRLYGLEERPDDARVRELAEPWRPYRSIATYFVWYALRSEDMPEE